MAYSLSRLDEKSARVDFILQQSLHRRGYPLGFEHKIGVSFILGGRHGVSIRPAQAGLSTCAFRHEWRVPDRDDTVIREKSDAACLGT